MGDGKGKPSFGVRVRKSGDAGARREVFMDFALGGLLNVSERRRGKDPARLGGSLGEGILIRGGVSKRERGVRDTRIWTWVSKEMVAKASAKERAADSKRWRQRRPVRSRENIGNRGGWGGGGGERLERR